MIKAVFVFIPVIKTYIKACLESLYENTPIEFRVIVVDQTVDGIYDEVKDLTDLYLRPKRKNLGFSKANNEGIIHALHWGSEYIIPCNDDVIFLDKRWWQGILDQFEQYPKMMAVNPASIIEPGWGYGIENPETFKCPDWGIVVGKNIHPKKPDGTAFTFEEALTKEGYDWLLTYKQGHIEGFAGWCVVGKREMWENIGLYDEKFYFGGAEDYDMNHRIYLAGGRCSATMRSWVWHYWSKSKEAKKEELPPLSRPVFQNVNGLYEHSPDGATSPIYPPRDHEPFGNKRIRKSLGVFIDDIR